MYIEYAKELIDKNIVRFEVANGAWVGEVKKDNDTITLYCKDYGGSLVRTMNLKEDSKIDLSIEKIKYKFEEIDDMNQIIKECYEKIEKSKARLLELGETPEIQKPKKIIGTIENGVMKRVFSCCNKDCTTLTCWMTPDFCPYCGTKIENN